MFVKSLEKLHLVKDAKEKMFVSGDIQNNFVANGQSTDNLIQEKGNLRLSKSSRTHHSDINLKGNLQLLQLSENVRCFDGKSTSPESLWTSPSSSTTSSTKNLVTDEESLDFSEKGDNHYAFVPFANSRLEGKKMCKNANTVSDQELKKENFLPVFSLTKQTEALKMLKMNPKTKADSSQSVKTKSKDSVQGTKKYETRTETRQQQLTVSAATKKKFDSKVVFKLPTVDSYELTPEYIVHGNTCTALSHMKRRLKKTKKLPSRDSCEKSGKSLKLRNSVYTQIAQQFVKFDQLSLVEGTRMKARVSYYDRSTLQALKAVKECNPTEIQINRKAALVCDYISSCEKKAAKL